MDYIMTNYIFPDEEVSLCVRRGVERSHAHVHTLLSDVFFSDLHEPARRVIPARQKVPCEASVAK